MVEKVLESDCRAGRMKECGCKKEGNDQETSLDA